MKENKKENKMDINGMIIESALPLGVLYGLGSAFGNYIMIGGTSVSSIALGVSSAVTLPVVGVGAVGLASAYGVYSILTKGDREIAKERIAWFEFFKNTNICVGEGERKSYPVLFEKEDYDYGSLYKFVSPVGLSTHMLDGKDIALKEYLGANQLKYFIKDGILFIQSFISELPLLVPFRILDEKSTDINVVLGKNNKLEDVIVALNKVHTYLIVGATGTGKSVCTHNILSQLYSTYTTKEEMLFYLADFKTTELTNYKDIVNTVRYTNKVNEAEEIVDELLKICDERHELFSKTSKGIKNLAQYNNYVTKSNKLPYIVFVIEECARMMSDNGIQKKVAELGFICRSAGIIMILTIQKPTKSLFSPDIRASMLATICFKTTTKKNSEIICGDSRLRELRGNGDCWIITDDIKVGEQMIQGAYLKESNIDNVLEKNCKFK